MSRKNQQPESRVRHLASTLLLAGLFLFAGFSVRPTEEVSLRLPAGFKASLVVDELGRNRHLAIHPNGDVYIKLARLKDGKGIFVLRDKDGDGKLEVINSFGDYKGTGITIKDGYLYACSDEEVFRYKFNNKNEILSPDSPERIVTGLVAGRQHNTKSVALDDKGNLYVIIGAPR